MKFIMMAVFGFFIPIIGAGTLGFVPTWLLWNWLIPDLFGVQPVSLIESLGLVLLVGCLFGSLNGWAESR